MRETLLTNAPWLSLVLLYIASAVVLHAALDLETPLDIDLFSPVLNVIAFIVVLVLVTFHAIRVRLAGGSILDPAAWPAIADPAAFARRAAGFLLVLLTIVPFMTTFGGLKRLIPTFHPFSLDPVFMRWDRLLHAGSQPWELLQPLIGHAWVTNGIDQLYYMYLPVVAATVLWFAAMNREPLRTRFLVSYAVCWILLGTIMATLLSSAGPIFYGRVVEGLDPYAPLVEYLNRVSEVHSLNSLWVREHLWNGYIGAISQDVSGISAMPSLHVAVTFLFVLAARRINTAALTLYGLFAALTLVGSVHLGWHYAIDGYASIICVISIWYVVGRFASWYRKRFWGPASADRRELPKQL